MILSVCLVVMVQLITSLRLAIDIKAVWVCAVFAWASTTTKSLLASVVTIGSWSVRLELSGIFCFLLYVVYEPLRHTKVPGDIDGLFTPV